MYIKTRASQVQLQGILRKKMIWVTRRLTWVYAQKNLR